MIKVQTFDLSDERSRKKYEDLLNESGNSGGKKIIMERIDCSEGYYYIFVKYTE